MRKRFGIALIVLLLIGMGEFLTKTLALISAPSDAKMYGGIVLLLALVLIGPQIIKSLWKWSNKNNETPKAA